MMIRWKSEIANSAILIFYRVLGQILQNFFLPRLLHHFICQFFKLLMTVTDKNDLDKATPQLFHMAPSYKQNFPVKLRFARFERSDWLLHFV